jgi:hypothetical protein
MRSYQLVKGADPQLRNVVLEVRYSRSGSFYSRFGAILDVLSETRPDWFFSTDGKSGIGGNFVCISSGLDITVQDNRVTAALSKKPDLAPYGKDEIAKFADECVYFLDVYTSNCKPLERSRIGFRQIFEADFSEKSAANEWILSLGLIKPHSGIEQSFGMQIDDISFSMVLRGTVNDLRIAVESGEKSATFHRGENTATVHAHMLSENQKAALLNAERKSAFLKRSRSYSATIDFDSFCEAPSGDVAEGEFIKRQHEEVLGKLISSMEVTK